MRTTKQFGRMTATCMLMIGLSTKTQADDISISDGTNPWTDISGTNNVTILGSATLGADNIVNTLNISPTADGKSLQKGSFSSITINSDLMTVLPNNVQYAFYPNLIFNGGGIASIIQVTGNMNFSGQITAENGLDITGGGAGFNITSDSSGILGTFTTKGIVRFMGGVELADNLTVNQLSGTLYMWDGGNVSIGELILTDGTISQGGNANPVYISANTFTLKKGTVSNVPLIGSGDLVKSTSETVSLSGASTYGGTTTVNGGTLAVTGSIASTNWVIASGATLSFASATTLGGKTLTLDASGAAAGLLSVTGDLTLGGNLVLTDLVAERKIAQSTTAISGTFAKTTGGLLELRNGNTELWAYPAPRATEIVIR